MAWITVLDGELADAEEAKAKRRQIRSEAARHGHLLKRKLKQDNLLSQLRSTTPSIPRLGSYADNPFGGYPVPAQIWFPEIVDYFCDFLSRGWKNMNVTDEERAEAYHWVRHLTMIHPAYFYANMLSTMKDLVERGLKDPRWMLWLNGRLISTVHQALIDPDKTRQVGTLLVVGRLAVREILMGDYQSGVSFHRPAFARLAAMAGGIHALPVPSLVRTHLYYTDSLVTKITGLALSDLEPSLASDPRPSRSCRSANFATLRGYYPKSRVRTSKAQATEAMSGTAPICKIEET